MALVDAIILFVFVLVRRGSAVSALIWTEFALPSTAGLKMHVNPSVLVLEARQVGAGTSASYLRIVPVKPVSVIPEGRGR